MCVVVRRFCQFNSRRVLDPYDVRVPLTVHCEVSGHGSSVKVQDGMLYMMWGTIPQILPLVVEQ